MAEQVKDWRANLSEEDAALLNELVQATQKHKAAYSESEDPAVAQLWTALLELRKREGRLKDLAARFEKFISRLEMAEKEARIEKSAAAKIKKGY